MARTYKDISYTAMERKADGDMRTLAHSRRVRHMANGGALAGRIDALEHGVRCDGYCPYCSDNRLHATRRAMEAADAKLGEVPGRISGVDTQMDGKEPDMAEKVSPLDMEFEPDERVVVYQGGTLVYEGPWGERDDEYDGDWYTLADVEMADIVIIDIR